MKTVKIETFLPLVLKQFFTNFYPRKTVNQVQETTNANANCNNHAKKLDDHSHTTKPEKNPNNGLKRQAVSSGL